MPCIQFSQDEITGIIFEDNQEKERIPLLGANVYWVGTTIGTTTNENGQFTIAYKKSYSKLIISYVGFKTDTLTINGPKQIEHWSRIGKIAEENPDLTLGFVMDLLVGLEESESNLTTEYEFG